VLDLKSPSVRQILRTFFPAMIGLSISQFNLLQLPIIFASFFGPGTTLVMRLAQRLIVAPMGLFGVSIATASFPTMARYAAEGNRDALRHTLAKGVRAICFFAIPSSVACATLALPLNRILWRGGQFSEAAVARTAFVMACFALGLVALCAIQIVTRGFYAVTDFRTPPLVGLGTFFLNLALCWGLMHTALREAGIALGISLAFWANLGILILLLRGRLGGIEGRNLLDAVVRTLACCAPMALAFWYVPRAVGTPFPSHPAISAAVQVAAAGMVGGVLFLTSAIMLRLPEVASAKEMVSRKLRRRPGLSVGAPGGDGE
jgi:putative peptidoglycan lipid II flippase